MATKKRTRPARSGEITVLPPDFVPMTEQQYSEAVNALAEMITHYMAKHPEKFSHSGAEATGDGGFAGPTV